MPVMLRVIVPHICCSLPPPSVTAGVTWQRSSCIDGHGSPLLCDAYGAPLTFSGQSSDSSVMGLASMVYRCETLRGKQILQLKYQVGNCCIGAGLQCGKGLRWQVC